MTFSRTALPAKFCLAAKYHLAAILCLVALSPGTGTIAQTAPAALDEAGAPPLELSLADAVRMGLQNNLDIRVANYNPELRAQDILLREAAFDPNASIFAEKQDTSRPVSTLTDIGLDTGDPNFVPLFLGIEQTRDVLFSLDQEQDNFNLAFFDPLRYGASYEAGLFMQRFETNSANNLLPVSYFTQFIMAYNQNLLRGFGREASETQIVIAQADYEISRSDYRNQVFTSLQGIEDAYWELVFARQDLAVKNESLGLAQELLKLNRIKVEVGTLPPIEITQAEAEVASREQAVIIAENVVGDAEDNLRRALNMPKEENAWTRPILPTEEPTLVERPIDLENELQEALANRPDLERARLEMQRNDTQVAFDKSELKWGLDFRATYAFSGLAGDNLTAFAFDPSSDPNMPTFNTFVNPLNEDLSDSLSTMADRDFDSWTASLILNIPIGNNAAQANYMSSRLAKEQSAIAYENTRLAAEVEVRAAARGIQSDRKRIEASEKNVELQRKKVEAEQKKFENGMSTSFQVLEFQEDLTTALGDKNRALVDYRKSITSLEKAKGTLDKYLNVSVR